MITRVTIENLVIVEHAEFEPGPSLTSVTGETGAGKTLLATAISLLFGGDASASQVGVAGSHAWVEGEFEPHDGFWSHPSVAVLAQLRPEPDAPLVLARRIESQGRSRALAWGRTITKADLANAGALLVASAGQHAQRRLLQPSFQRDAVDRAGGDTHTALIEAMATAFRLQQTAAARVEHVRADIAAFSANLEILRDDLERLDGLQPSRDDEAALVSQRELARNHAQLTAALAAAHASLDADGVWSTTATAGVSETLGLAYNHLQQAAVIDPDLNEVAANILALQEQVGEVVLSLGSRLGALADGPASIDDIEDRLAAYDDAKRRHGGTIESVIAAWTTLSDQVQQVDQADEVLADAVCDHESAVVVANGAADSLRISRQAIADQLEADVVGHLDALAMAGSVFQVMLLPTQRSAHGDELVELRLSPAADIEPRPVAEVASGGELSRIALALLVASGASEADTLIFDEIDAGIGGHTGHAIASLLRQLAEHTQVICITHLPQVAARATHHVVINKQDGRTSLSTLSGELAVIDELCRMLGADPRDPIAREHASGLRGPRIRQNAREMQNNHSELPVE